MTKTSSTDAGRTRIGDKVTIRRRGKRGTYIAEFFHHGEHRKRSLKTSNKEIARRRAIDLESELAGGEYARPPKPISVTSAITEYMQMKTGEGRKHRTLVKYRDWLDSFATFCTAAGVHTLQQI